MQRQQINIPTQILFKELNECIKNVYLFNGNKVLLIFNKNNCI